MAQQNIITLKNWFRRGLKPLQQQFWDWLDSYWHKEEPIPIASIEGLATVLNSLPSQDAINTIINLVLGETQNVTAPGSYTISPNRLLEKILVQSATGIAFKIGSSAEGDDILPEIPIEAGKPQLISLDLYASEDKTIYLSGFTTPITVTFYKR